MSEKKLASYLKMMRKSNNRSQDEMAEMLEVKRATYSHYETGRVLPPTEGLYKLAVYYGEPVSKLVNMAVEDAGIKIDTQTTFASEYEELHSEVDKLKSSCYVEMSNMSGIKLNSYVTAEDKELLYAYHKLGDTDRKIIIDLTENMVVRKAKTI